MSATLLLNPDKQAEKPLYLWIFPNIKFIFPFSFAKYELCLNFFQIKVVSVQFRTKKSVGASCVYHFPPPPLGGELGPPNIGIFKILKYTKMAK